MNTFSDFDRLKATLDPVIRSEFKIFRTEATHYY
jgi:hypothetical protein